MNLEYVGLLGSVVLILVAVLVFFLFSQRRLKANAQRIREEYGQPGERDLAIAQSSDAALARWGATATDPAGDPAGEAIEQLDAKIAQAHEAARAAEQQIARLQALIERAQQIGR